MQSVPLIVFEGIDQSGKKTQAKMLGSKLRSFGFNVTEVSFPDYSTPLGREIRSFLLGRRSYPDEVRHMLLAANRLERRDYILRQLRSGSVVIVNRYSQSNIAYGVAKGLNARWLESLERGLPKADLTILIDISPKVSLQRKRTQRDIFEKSLVLLHRVRRNYLKLAGKQGWIIVNGERPAGIVHQDTFKAVKGFLKKVKQPFPKAQQP